MQMCEFVCATARDGPLKSPSTAPVLISQHHEEARLPPYTCRGAEEHVNFTQNLTRLTEMKKIYIIRDSRGRNNNCQLLSSLIVSHQLQSRIIYTHYVLSSSCQHSKFHNACCLLSIIYYFAPCVLCV
jgi:hypothetical protein